MALGARYMQYLLALGVHVQWGLMYLSVCVLCVYVCVHMITISNRVSLNGEIKVPFGLVQSIIRRDFTVNVSFRCQLLIVGSYGAIVATICSTFQRQSCSLEG